MEQLLLKMDEKSEVKVIAASAFNFRIELVKKVGKDDIPGLIDISQCMADTVSYTHLTLPTKA